MTTSAPLNTRYTLSLLSTHSTDSSPSLLVTFDNHRYLFNTPESISRVCVQNKIGMKKIGQAFLGRLEESTGLPGFVLSTVEAGNREVELFGPKGFDHFMASCRYFTRREHLSLKISSPSPLDTSAPLSSLPTPVYADPNLIVYALPLTPEVSAGDAAMSNGSPSLKRKRSSASPSPPPRAKSPPASTTSTSEAIADPLTAAAASALFDPYAPNFTPSHLRGEAAALWRTMVLRDMFRGKSFLTVAEESTVGTSTNPYLANAPPTNGRRTQSPAYLQQALPPPTDAVGGKVAPSAVSYLAVGPPLRGKFQREVAKRRGVKPGAAFARLTRGERVWVSAKAKASAEEEERVSAEAAQAKVAGAPVEKNVPPKESKKERAERAKREKAEEEQVVEGEGEGEWVEAKDCMTEGQEASAFLVLNIPSPAYLPSLLALSPTTLSTLPQGGNLRTIFYFLGPGVLADDRLGTFMNSFPSSLDLAHRISSPDLIAKSNPVTFVPSALLSLRLNYLDPAMFSLPQYSFLPPASPSLLPPSLPSSTSVLSTNDRFSNTHSVLPPPQGVDYRSFNFEVPSAESALEASRLKGAEKSTEVQRRASEAWQSFQARAAEVKAEVEKLAKEREDRLASGEVKVAPGDDLQVTPLGTGSAIPSKYRNVSSTLLHLPPTEGKEQAFVLLDAGEGTWGQLARRFELAGARDVLRGIKLLFISHLHQDHHAGLTTIMRERSMLDPPPMDPITIIGPPGVRVYLTEQNYLFDVGLDSAQRSSARGKDVRFIDSGVVEAKGKEMRDGDWRLSVMSDLKSLLGLKEVLSVPVLHRCRCWGLVIEHESGWKAAFSGDTMPCDALVEAGQGASLLVHEATIQDDLPDVAHAKGHSTFGQAIDVARRMNARHLLLTHFSARYPKLPPLTHSSPVDSNVAEPTVAIAFDLATLRLDEFWKMSHYQEPMDLLFSWDEAEEDEETKEVVKAE